MTTIKTRQQVWYDFVLQQMAAESFLDDVSDTNIISERLGWGSNDGRVVRNPDDFRLNTRMTAEQRRYFIANWEIIDQHANDATGFSATLLRKRGTEEYTLSFRSTEFSPWANGGDRERDTAFSPIDHESANMEISFKGFAFGQIASMEKYYAKLKASHLAGKGPINATGYSLGGHLATVFTELHAEDVKQTYSFNGAGRGTIEKGNGEQYQRISSLIARFTSVFEDLDQFASLFPMSSNLSGDLEEGRRLFNQAVVFRQDAPSWDPFASEPSATTAARKISAYQNPVYLFAKWLVGREYQPQRNRGQTTIVFH